MIRISLLLNNDVLHRYKPQQRHRQVTQGTHFHFSTWQEWQKENTSRHEINERDSTIVFDQKILFVSNSCIGRQIQ